MKRYNLVETDQLGDSQVLVANLKESSGKRELAKFRARATELNTGMTYKLVPQEVKS